MDMSHGSELPKVTSVYLETAGPIDWNSTMKVCCAMKDDFASHRIYIVQAVAAWLWAENLGQKTPILRLEIVVFMVQSGSQDLCA